MQASYSPAGAPAAPAGEACHTESVGQFDLSRSSDNALESSHPSLEAGVAGRERFLNQALSDPAAACEAIPLDIEIPRAVKEIKLLYLFSGPLRDDSIEKFANDFSEASGVKVTVVCYDVLISSSGNLADDHIWSLVTRDIRALVYDAV